MKPFSSITPERLREIAFAATYKISYFPGDPHVITDETLAGFSRYGQLIHDELQARGNVDNIDLERFLALAKEATGFVPYDMFEDKSGIVDHMKIIASGAQEVFYTRLAYRIAAELQQ